MKQTIYALRPECPLQYLARATILYLHHAVDTRGFVIAKQANSRVRSVEAEDDR
jgi:hypothetical protein